MFALLKRNDVAAAAGAEREKRKNEPEPEVSEPEQCRAEAEKLHQRTLSELDRSLAIKREERVKTARFSSALRPVAFKK